MYTYFMTRQSKKKKSKIHKLVFKWTEILRLQWTKVSIYMTSSRNKHTLVHNKSINQKSNPNILLCWPHCVFSNLSSLRCLCLVIFLDWFWFRASCSLRLWMAAGNYWRVTGELLENWWNISGELLKTYWNITWELQESYCSFTGELQ